MSEIKAFPIREDEALKASPFFSQEVFDALKKGLPLTAFVAVKDSEAIGAVAGAIDGHIFEIWSIYVDPQYRRQGAGTVLIKALEELLESVTEDKTAVAGMPIRVRYTSLTEDNRALRPFFLKLGFVEDPIPHPMYYVGYLDDIKSRDKISSRSLTRVSGIVPFSQTEDKLLKLASNVSAQQGYPMPEGGLLSGSVNRELSFCIVREGKIGAYVTVEEIDEDLVEVSALWSGLENPMELLSMLIILIDALRKKYSPETKVAMLATNDRADKLVDYLFRYVEPRSLRMVKITNL
ncbi:MAG: GNAT family N-acetyltransferase [Lachnospiraceae bacterium]|nr:GNAT family N-acetyltransferase [Lachnospiraceae bacterium]